MRGWSPEITQIWFKLDSLSVQLLLYVRSVNSTNLQSFNVQRNLLVRIPYVRQVPQSFGYAKAHELITPILKPTRLS